MTWSSDGKFFYVVINRNTSVIPVPAGTSLPDLTASGIGSVELPGTRVIKQGNPGHLSPGPDPSTYVFQRTEIQRNLFRMSLH